MSFAPSSADFRGLLEALVGGGVDFIVVGGVAAALLGAGSTTLDLDIVPSRSEDNRERLLTVLRELEACYREHLPKVLEPTLQDLASDGHMLLMTRLGPLDVLGTIGGGRSYDDLLPGSDPIEIAPGRAFRSLGLQALIRVKEATNREKDRLHLAMLRRLLEERERGER